MNERLYVFHAKTPDGWRGNFRPQIHAWPASAIKSVESQVGSENCHLVINGIAVEGSFDTFVKEWTGEVIHGAPILREKV